PAPLIRERNVARPFERSKTAKMPGKTLARMDGQSERRLQLVPFNCRPSIAPAVPLVLQGPFATLAEAGSAGAPLREALAIVGLFGHRLAPAPYAVAVQDSAGDGCLYGAAQLTLVPTVAESAGGRQRGHFGEHVRNPRGCVDQLQFPHARRIQQPPARRH